MARKLWLCFEAAQAPALNALQAQIRALGFKLTVDEGYAPFETAGYLPCTLEGEDAGVDLRFEADAPLPDAAAALEAERGARRAVARLSWGGDPREELSALVLAMAFAQLAQGLIVDPDKGQVVLPDVLMNKARALLADSF